MLIKSRSGIYQPIWHISYSPGWCCRYGVASTVDIVLPIRIRHRGAEKPVQCNGVIISTLCNLPVSNFGQEDCIKHLATGRYAARETREDLWRCSEMYLTSRLHRHQLRRDQASLRGQSPGTVLLHGLLHAFRGHGRGFRLCE